MAGAMGILRVRVGALLCVALVFAWAGTARAANTITVNSTSDAAPSVSECSGVTNDCSIRQAIDKASSGDTIHIPPGTYLLTLKSTLTGGGALSINKSLTIEGTGSGASDVVIKPGTGFDDRLIHITGTPTVLFNELSLNNGFQSQVQNDNDGSAAIKKDGGETTLTNVILDHDVTNLGSGAIHNVAGDLILEDDTFSNDQAFSGGGLTTDAGTVSISNSTFASNENTGGEGGAIYATGGSVVVTNTTVVDGGFGSAIGGGIANNGATVSVDETTLNGNSRGSIETESGTTTVRNSIVDACVPSGQSTVNSTTTTDPITTDLGNNVFGDSSCGANGDNDKSGALDLAPLADNTGKTETEAVLVGSTALTVTGSGCASSDQRGVTRPSGQCTPGAFQAVLIGNPTTAITDAASSIGGSNARLNGTINLDGEAGAYHFIYGTSSSLLDNSTAPVGAGVVSANKSVSDDLTGLTPGTTYFFKVVATNASGETIAADPPQQFTTLAKPTVTNPTSTSVTATSATLGATINPNGDDTTYHVDYLPHGGGTTRHTTTADIGSGTSPQAASQPVTGLTPNTAYDYTVVAHNNEGDSSAGGHFTTGTAPSTGKATLSGAVSQLLPYMPGFAKVQPAAPLHSPVRLTIATGKEQTHQTTRTGAGGTFRFTGLPSCRKSLAQTCTVAVLNAKSGAIEDQRTVQLGPGPSNTAVNLIYGAVPDRYVVFGAVLKPGAISSTKVSADLAGLGANPGPTTDLTVSENPGGKGPGSYDAAATCSKGGWSNTACKGGFGPYLLDLVRTGSEGKSARSSTPAITLWEKNRDGHMVAVDSAKLNLPADTAANRAEPPTTVAPDLHELDPVPSRSPGRSLTGHVTKLAPALPGASNRSAVDAGAEVDLVSTGKGESVLEHTKTDKQGDYRFLDVSHCQKNDRPCSVEVRGGKSNGVADVQPVKLGELSPSITVVDLQAGRVSDRFMISGSVTGPSKQTDLTVSLLEKGKPEKQIYDALKSCGQGGWAGATRGPGSCHSGVGAYLLGFVPPSANGLDRGKDGAKPHKAVLTLLERRGGGGMVPVDSARITLPADTKAQNEDPKIINVGPLHTIDPVPDKAGRSLFGRITEFQPSLPGTTPKARPLSGAEVTVRIKTGKDSVTKHTRSDKQGYYSVSELPQCGGGKDTCTVEVAGEGKARGIGDQRSFKLHKRTPSVTATDLQDGRVPDRVVVSGNVLAPPFAGSARPAPPTTDLIITVGKGTVIYDAIKACGKGGWAGGTGPSKCHSTAGSYQLGFVPPAKGGQPETATITLYETNPTGKGMSPIDSATITLPADTKQNREDPPNITAPDLQG